VKAVRCSACLQTIGFAATLDEATKQLRAHRREQHPARGASAGDPDAAPRQLELVASALAAAWVLSPRGGLLLMLKLTAKIAALGGTEMGKK
jgi:hypothetical protein